MNGMDAATGRPLVGEAHLRQSIARILSTPIGTRVARRDFGSVLPELVDQPMNPATRMRLFAATALALLRWEPRIKLTGVALIPGDTPGAFRLIVEGVRADVAAAVARTRLTLSLTPGGGITA